jgi:hypothetical protein
MRKLISTAASLLALAAMSPPAAAQTIPLRGDTPGHSCRIAGTQRFIGKFATKMMGAAIKDVSRAAVLRWAPPGAMLTMDFRADRVNVYVDARKVITKINCG